MNSKIYELKKDPNRGDLRQPLDALEDAIASVGKNGALERGKKVLILALDETDGEYDVSFFQAGMHMSDMIALCDIAKSEFKREMGY